MPASPRPKLCTIWQPTNSRNAARFPVFYSGNKSTTQWLGRVSPWRPRALASRAAPSRRRRQVFPSRRRPGFQAPPPLAFSKLHRRAPSRLSRLHHITSTRLHLGISSTPPQHLIDDAPASHRLPLRHPVSSAPASRLLCPGFPSQANSEPNISSHATVPLARV